MKFEYEVGDPCWIHNSPYAGLIEGKVARILDCEEDMNLGIQYLIIIETSVDAYLQVRPAMLMSEDEQGPIGLYRSIEETVSKWKKSKK